MHDFARASDAKRNCCHVRMLRAHYMYAGLIMRGAYMWNHTRTLQHLNGYGYTMITSNYCKAENTILDNQRWPCAISFNWKLYGHFCSFSDPTNVSQKHSRWLSNKMRGQQQRLVHPKSTAWKRFQPRVPRKHIPRVTVVRLVTGHSDQ